MQKIHKTIFINAPREKVWKTMLDDATYRYWTGAFSPGSYYKGSWEEGSKIQFLGPHPETGEEGGISSMIEVNRPYEFVSIAHLAEIKNGVEDFEGASKSAWAGAHENYTFEDKDGGTELTIDLDITENEKQMMEEMWDKGLARLKELAES